MKKMMEQGELKEINLEKKLIPSSFTELFEDTLISDLGSTIIQIKFEKRAIKEPFKEMLKKLYIKNYKDFEQIEIEGNLFHEVSFTYYLNKVTKTFYIKDKSKIRSEIDITSMIDDKNFKGEIPLKEFVEIYLKLIAEIS
jgi:hypothetical protein